MGLICLTRDEGLSALCVMHQQKPEWVLPLAGKQRRMNGWVSGWVSLSLPVRWGFWIVLYLRAFLVPILGRFLIITFLTWVEERIFLRIWGLGISFLAWHCWGPKLKQDQWFKALRLCPHKTQGPPDREWTFTLFHHTQSEPILGSQWTLRIWKVLNTIDSSFLLTCGVTNSLGVIFAWSTKSLPLRPRQVWPHLARTAWQTEWARYCPLFPPLVRHLLGTTQPEQLYWHPRNRVPRTEKRKNWKELGRLGGLVG